MRFQRLRKVVRWILRAILALAILLVLFVLEENIRGHIMLARYKAELRAKGEKLTLAEIELPKVPVEGNGVPALIEAANESEGLVLSNESQIRGLVQAQYAEPGKVVVCYREQHIPPVGVWESWGGRPGRYVTHSLDWTDLATAVTSMQPAVARAKLALQQPEFGIEVDYNKFLETGLPGASTEYLGSWLAVSTISELHDSDHASALDSIITLAKLGGRPLNKRLMSSQVARARICEKGLQATWEALQDNGWTDGQLSQMQQTWESVDLISDLPKVVDVQRAIDLSAWDNAASWRGFMETFLRRGGGRWRMALGSAIWDVWEIIWKSQDELRFMQMWDSKSEFLRHVTVSTSAYAPYQKLWDLKYAGSDGFYDSLPHLYSRMFFGYMIGDVSTIMRCETHRQMTLAAIALRRYQNVTGHPPADLNALVPAYLSALPRDCMDGKPLKYRLNPNGTWTLYSVGEDGVDDGGSLERSHADISEMWGARDAVWPEAGIKVPRQR